MDNRLRNILSLALHPSTGEGEAQAALNRARSMVAKGDLQALLGGSSESRERVVIQDRVVYRNPNFTHDMHTKFTIPQRWMHTFLERMFGDAAHYGCMVEMMSCKGQANSSTSGMVLEVTIHGTRDSLKRFDREIDRWMAVMRGETANDGGSRQKGERTRAGDTYSPSPPPPAPEQEQPHTGKTWWQSFTSWARQS